MASVQTSFLVIFIWFSTFYGTSEGVRDECCSLGNWFAWDSCDSECNGYRVRQRLVKTNNNPGCLSASCTDWFSGFDFSICNEFCYNGGTSDDSSCNCVTGFYGECCESQVNCGHPGSISNGTLNGGSFAYGGTVTYTCHSGYLLVDGSSSRTCQGNVMWSGTKPRCAFYDSCASVPCKNEAICTNRPDNYQCSCINGWNGKDCDIDIQPPVMKTCSYNKTIITTALTEYIMWQKPSFVDPHNFTIMVTANYPSNGFAFPWGDFNVSYTAIKPSNGLSANCLFSISLRPNQCPPINIPENGALICNNWKTDYGLFCTFICEESYTVPRGVVTEFYACGASGVWAPSNIIPNCSVMISHLHSTSGYSIGPTYSNCSVSRREMQEFYIKRLSQSDFNYFCKNFHQECIAENVSVQC